MQYRTNVKNDEQLSALGFGVMRFSSKRGRIPLDIAEPLLLKAFEQGVNYYDTAYLYDGSEALLGEVFEKNNIRDKVLIATKLPHILCKKAEDFDQFFDTQLKRLRTTYIDYYLLHNVTERAQWERLCSLGFIEWLEQKKAEGAIRQFGFSFHGTFPEFEKLLNTYDFDFVQIQYNYINKHYQAGIEGLNFAAEKGLPVIIMEPLLGGKLASSLPEEAKTLFKEANPESTPVSWALKWLWDHPAVTVILSGMNQMEQLDENLTLADTSLPNSMTAKEQATVEQVVEVFKSNYKVLCTGCNYCMPCPKEINIPGIFSAYNTSYSLGRFAGIYSYMTNNGLMSGTTRLASDCISCGVCINKCPQNLDIPQIMKDAKRRLQFPGFATFVPPLMGVALKSMRKGAIKDD